jgi:hypothetical protein
MQRDAINQKKSIASTNVAPDVPVNTNGTRAGVDSLGCDGCAKNENAIPNTSDAKVDKDPLYRTAKTDADVSFGVAMTWSLLLTRGTSS